MSVGKGSLVGKERAEVILGLRPAEDASVGGLRIWVHFSPADPGTTEPWVRIPVLQKSGVVMHAQNPSTQ